MPHVNLLPDELSLIRKMIRERYAKDPAKYEDALVAGDIAIENLLPGRTVPGAQVREIREAMNLDLTKTKPNYTIKPEEKKMGKRMRLSESELTAVTKFIGEHTGGEAHMTALELADEINKRRLTPDAIKFTFVNKIRKTLGTSSRGRGAAKGAGAKSPAAAGGNLSQVIESFKAKRDRLSSLIEQLEKVQAEGV